MISVAQLIIHLYFGAIAGGILGFTISTYSEWFPDEQEKPSATLPMVENPTMEEQPTGIAPRLEREGNYE